MESRICAAIIVLRWSVAAAEFGVAEHGAHVSIPSHLHLCANACCCGAFAPEDIGGIILGIAVEY